MILSDKEEAVLEDLKNNPSGLVFQVDDPEHEIAEGLVQLELASVLTWGIVANIRWTHFKRVENET